MLPCMKLHETVPWHLILLPVPLPPPPQGQASLAQSFFGEGPHEAQAWGLFCALSTPSLELRKTFTLIFSIFF